MERISREKNKKEKQLFISLCLGLFFVLTVLQVKAYGSEYLLNYL